MITLQVNGKPRDIEEGLNLQSYLATIDVNMRFIAVGYNGQVIRKEDFEKVQLNPGDALEIVRPVGGG
ncbi:MAG: sulfur carrier protein ThiS [Chloroflexota bacterium]|nr:sulfur carrier protein ThiS [Chloroflexota bacterium]MDE2958907.1 sulfur carrier protein ThiS [Chloroflexota bacterium]